MEHYNTSLLSRWRRVFLRGDALQPQCLRRTSTRSWPQKRSHDDQDAYLEECAPLLERSYTHSISSLWGRSWLSSSTTSSTTSITNPTIPPWCRLPSSSRFTRLATCFLITLLLFISPAYAAPLRSEPYRGLFERQSIPDRFGNTGNRPAPVAPPQPPQAATHTVGPASGSLVTSTTSLRVPSSSVVTSPSTVTTLAPATISVSAEVSIPTFETVTSSSLSTLILTLLSVSTIIPLPAPTTTSSPTISNIPPPTLDPSPSNPDTQLQRTEPQNPLSPATIAGIVLGSIILLAFLIGIVFLFQRRKKARQVKEITIRRSKLGSRLGLRIFGSHYDDSIARSRKVSLPEDVPLTKEIAPSYPSVAVKPPISPSIYSPLPLTRISTFTFGSGMDRLQPTFTGTPSQLLVAPRPLFAPGDGLKKEKVTPARPRSAEPLGRLSGMGYGLGLR